MNNIQLQEKIDELVQEKNFLTLQEKIADFTPAYKKTDFFKKTKIELYNLIKEFQEWDFRRQQPKNVGEVITDIMDNLDVNKVNDILGKLADVFQQENIDIMNEVKELKLEEFWTNKE